MVKFTMEKVGGTLTVTKIEPVRYATQPARERAPASWSAGSERSWRRSRAGA